MLVTIILEKGYSTIKSDEELPLTIKREMGWHDSRYRYTFRHREYGWDGWEFLIKGKKFPTGLFSLLLRSLYKHNIEVEVINKIPSIEPIDNNLFKEVCTDLSLRFYQIEMFRKILEKQKGLIRAPTGTGKTRLGLAIAKYANTLGKDVAILTPTIAINKQWVKKAKELEIDVGYIRGSSKHKIRPTTVVSIQKASKKMPYELISKFFDNGWLICDECLTGDTLISLADGGIETMKCMLTHKLVVGGKPSGWFKRETDKLYKVETQFGELKCTPTHKHIVLSREILSDESTEDRPNKYRYKPLSESQISIKTTEELLPTDCLLVPETLPHTTKNTLSKEELGFVALIACDGHIEKDNSQCVKVAYRKKYDLWQEKIFEDFANTQGIKISKRINTRQDKIISLWNKWVKTFLTHRYRIPEGKKSSDIDIINDIFYAPLDSIKEFLRVCFGCEGSDYGTHIILDMTSKLFITKLQLLLKKFGIHSTTLIKKRPNPNHADVHRLRIENKDYNKFIEQIGFPNKEMHKTPTTNRNDVITYQGISYRLNKIKNIKETPPEIVYDFNVNPTHTFIANGILTSNCHLWGAETFQKTTMTHFGRCERKYGMTATLFRTDNKEILYNAVMGECIANYSYSDAIEEGWIVPPIIRFQKLQRAIKLTNWEVRNWHGKGGRMGGKQKAITQNIERNQKIVENVDELIKEGRPTIVFVDTEEHASILQRYHNLDIPLVWSGNKLRYELLEDFTLGKVPAIIGTTMIDIGVDIPRASGAVMASGGKSPVRYYQRIGRLLRPFPNAENNEKKSALIYDFIDNGCSVVADHAMLRARVVADEKAFTVQTDSDLFALRVGKINKIRR